MAKKNAGAKRSWRIDFWKVVDVGAVAVIILVAAAWIILDDGQADVGGDAGLPAAGSNASLSALSAVPQGASRLATVSVTPDS